MLQQRENRILGNGANLRSQSEKNYAVGIPIPGKRVERPVSAYHASSSGFFSSSEESDGSPAGSPVENPALSSSYHSGFMTSNGNNVPLNIYGTSPRTSVMFNYYSSPKGSYARSHHPHLVRTRSTDAPSNHHPVPTHSRSENTSFQSTADTSHDDPKGPQCKVSSKLCQHLQQQVDNRPRAWSESDKNRNNASLQNSRLSALRKLKMKLGQKGGIKRQKSQEEDEKVMSPANVTSLEKVEEGRQLDCASGQNARAQTCSPEYGKSPSLVHQEHETRKKAERRTGVVRHPSPNQTLQQVKENPEDCLVYQRFLEEHTCYDLMPTSSKLVLLDTRLEVKKAFHALIENSLRCAPLWDNEMQDYVGLLTVSDFVSILLAYHKCPNKKLEDLENQKISCWREILNSKKTLIRVPPQASILDALKCLTEENIRRLAIVHPDNGDVFHVINHRRILHFLHLFMNELPRPKYMLAPIRDLGLGTCSKVATVTEDSPVIDALKLLDQHKVSGLPVVDPKGCVTDMFTKTDVLVLAGEQLFYDLSIKVKSVISLHAAVELDPELAPTFNRMMPGSPALVRRKNQPRDDHHHPHSSTPVKAHPFLRDSDNAPRLLPSPLVTSSKSSNRQSSDGRKSKDRQQHHHPAGIRTSGGKESFGKGDPGVISPPSTPQVFLHRRRHLSSQKSKSTSISSHLVTVTKDDTLESVMTSIVTADVLQAVIVDDFDHVQGVISIGDILRYMIYPTDKDGKVIRPISADKPPINGSSSFGKLLDVPDTGGRARTASDDTDMSSSVARKGERSLTASTADSGYSDESLPFDKLSISSGQSTSFMRQRSATDSESSSDTLLKKSTNPASKPPSVQRLKSGEKMDRL